MEYFQIKLHSRLYRSSLKWGITKCGIAAWLYFRHVLLQYVIQSNSFNFKNMSCQKENWNGCCCCNCENHYEDFYHCTTEPRPEGVEGCVCSTHKGWICMASIDGEKPRAHSGWGEHGMYEMHQYKQQEENVCPKCGSNKLYVSTTGKLCCTKCVLG